MQRCVGRMSAMRLRPLPERQKSPVLAGPFQDCERLALEGDRPRELDIRKPWAKSCFVHCSEDNPFRKLALVHSVVHRASVKPGAWFDRQPRTYAVSIRSSVGPRAGQRGAPAPENDR